MLFLIFPQLSRSFYTLLKNIPNYAKDLQLWAEDVLTSLQISPDVLHNFELDWKKITDVAEGWIQKLSPDVLGSMVQFTSALAGGIFNFVLGVAFSVYMLLKKETLCRQTKRLLFAFISKDKAEYLVSIARLSSAVFSRFVSGQLLEAFIIGFLCFLGMCAFSMPYALLISVIIGVTALVPIFGAFFGTALGAFILLMVHPMTAFWFVVFILILQQIESNVIYPRVQGKFVGLPGMWVLFAVTVGGGVFGVAGMLIGVPLASVLYCLLREAVAVRLQAKRRLKEENAVVEHKDAAPGASNETEETNTDDDNQANEENGEKE